jgi:threonine dehydratase
METAAGGLATRAAFELTQRILWQHFDDFVLVSENVMLQAIDLYVEKHTAKGGRR